MKKNKVIIIIVVILAVLIGIAYGIFKVMDSIKQDKLKIEQQIKEINEYYNILNENATIFNSKKEQFDQLMNNMYYETVSKNNDKVVNVLKEYDEIISKIKDSSNNLENRCNIYYKDAEVMQKCNSYKISYESAMTVFVADVKRYNNFVENYNKWTEDNTNHNKISTYVSKNI